MSIGSHLLVENTKRFHQCIIMLSNAAEDHSPLIKSGVTLSAGYDTQLQTLKTPSKNHFSTVRLPNTEDNPALKLPPLDKNATNPAATTSSSKRIVLPKLKKRHFQGIYH